MIRRLWRRLRREDAIQEAASKARAQAIREAARTVVEFTKHGGRIGIGSHEFLLNSVALKLGDVIVRPETDAIFFGMDKALYQSEKWNHEGPPRVLHSTLLDSATVDGVTSD